MKTFHVYNKNMRNDRELSENNDIYLFHFGLWRWQVYAV